MKMLIGSLMIMAVGVTGAQKSGASNPPARLSTGATLPSLQGEFLTGEKAVLPDSAAGKTALIAMGFTYESRFAVEEWIDAFRNRLAANQEGVTFFEVPMIGGIARLGRWFIDSGMRKGTPKEQYRNVITIYGGTGPWKERLSFREENAAYLILIDPKGIIRWLHAGRFDESKFQELSRAYEDARRNGSPDGPGQ